MHQDLDYLISGVSAARVMRYDELEESLYTIPSSFAKKINFRWFEIGGTLVGWTSLK